MTEQKQIVNDSLSVEQLIERLAKVKDKSKLIYLTQTGFLTDVVEDFGCVADVDESTCVVLSTDFVS